MKYCTIIHNFFAHPQYTTVEDSLVREPSVIYEGTCTDAPTHTCVWIHKDTRTHTHTEDIVLYRNPIFVPDDPGEADFQFMTVATNNMLSYRTDNLSSISDGLHKVKVSFRRLMFQF